MIVIMNRFDRYSRTNVSQILKIQIDPNISFEKLFDDIFLSYTSEVNLVSIDSVRSGALTELVYNVTLKKNADKQKFLYAIKEHNNNLKVTLVTGYNTTDL